MPMIDVYAAAGTFADTHRLAVDLATAVMTIEQVPDIPMFRQNTAAFVHELPAGSLSNVDGEHSYVRIQVLTNTGALDRDKQLAVVEQLTHPRLQPDTLTLEHTKCRATASPLPRRARPKYGSVA